MPLQISEDKERKSKTREIKVVDMVEKTLQTSEARGGLPKEKEMQEVEVEEKMVAQRGSGEQQQLMEPVSQESDITTKEDQAQCQVRDPTNLSDEVRPVIKKAGIDGREHENTEERIEVAEGKKVDKKKAMGKILCNVEAALLIQSAYRGYEVRRWEPLKKLRQIARIRKQVDEIREQIQDIESSAKLQVDEKQRVVLNETIMSLLLQLDTFQGLHPDVREIRKSVARELVCLQEKLDSFATETTTESLIEKACRDDDKTTQENDSVLMESTSKPAETSELLINGDVASDASQSNEATGTAISVEEQHEVKQKEILEMPLVDAEWFQSKREEHTNHPTLVEHTSSVTSSEELTQVHTENDGRCSSEVEVLVGSPPSVNVEQPEEDSNDLDTVRDEEDSAVNDKLVKSLQIDGYLDSIVDKLSEAAPMVAEEEAAHTLEQVPLAKDDQVESQEANEEAISGPESPETMLTGDECVNSVVEEVLPDTNRTLEIEVEEVDTMSVVKGEHNSEHVDLPLISELSSLAVKEKDAECMPVEEEGSLEYAENQLLYSGSDIDATVKIATPELDDQGNNVEVVSGGNKRSDAEAMFVMAENPIPEEVGECNTDKGISEDDKVESPSEEKGMNPSLDIFEATTISHEIEMESQTPEAEVSVEAITAVESLPPHSTPESDVEQGSNAENDSLSVSCGDPVPPTEVELQKEDKDLAGENDKLKEMLEKLLQAGKQQLTVISDLNGKVRDLEKKLAKKKKMKIRRQKAVASSCIMHKDNLMNQMASTTSMV
ncbi:hypothetical protein MRB53_030207 [Persea americana]|uniref:Uncharacterized protein n=1 Tax=Persea americana TaxID=3435 RepID=A0ACC2KKW6_PERAE|nr:hypothetical protein MRB53_030207 [Persea americana]